jgi:O-antigen/teichoic acid export membrane protein
VTVCAALMSDESPSPSPAASLKRRFLGTAGWSLAGHVLTQLPRFVSNLILTRLLAPDVFGVMSVAYLVFTGIAMLSDIGLGAIANQNRRGHEPRFLNVLWVVQIARGVLITLIALVLAWSLTFPAVLALLPSDSVYADPRIPMLVAAMSLSGLIGGLQSTRIYWARRNLSIAAVTKLELFCQLATTVIILVWAWIHPTIWAIAIGWLIGEALRAGLSHVVLPGPANKFEWDREIFREIMAFGKWVLVSSPISFMVSSGDRVLLGAYLDPRTMGLYFIAVLLSASLQAAIERILANAAQPALAEVYRERPQDLRETLYKIRVPLGIACIVPAGALFVLGDAVIQFLYDSRYAEAGWMLSAMSLVLAVATVSIFDQCLIAMGRMKRLSAINMSRLVVLYTLVPTSAWMWGTKGAIIAIPAAAVVNALVLLVTQYRLGLLDVKKDLMAFPLFGAGMLAGWLVLQVVQLFS